MCKMTIVTDSNIKLHRPSLVNEIRFLDKDETFDDQDYESAADRLENFLSGKTVDFRGQSIAYFEKAMAGYAYQSMKENKSIEKCMESLILPA